MSIQFTVPQPSEHGCGPPITTRLGLPFVMLQKLLLRECTLVRYYVLDLYLPTIGIHAYWDK